MSLSKCKDCKKDVSSDCKSCLYCGAKVDKGVGCLPYLLAVFFLFCMSMVIMPDSNNRKTTSNPAKVQTEAEKFKSAHLKRRDSIKSCFSAWDGSHRGLVRSVKSTMHDPGSFEHVKTVYFDKTDYLLVTMTFRGKNAFGGLVRQTVTAESTLSGRIYKFID